jgi:hypothetical protein
MSELDAIDQRTLSFIFTRCQARLDGDDLVVTVPSPVSFRAAVATRDSAGIDWRGPFPATGELRIDCSGAGTQRLDVSDYQVTHAYPEAVAFRFTGGVFYGRTLSRDGWALAVSGAVESADGLPDGWQEWDALLIESASPTKERSVRPGDAPGPVRDGISRLNGGSLNGPHLPFP